MKTETFLVIPNFENYEVSDLGKVRNEKTKNELTNCQNKDGYYYVILYKNLKRSSLLVHRLVAKVFIKNDFNKKCVNHKNGKKTDNRKNNLEWSTNSENTTHAHKTGLIKSKAKLSDKEKQEISTEKSTNKISILAEKYGVSHSTIYRALRQE